MYKRLALQKLVFYQLTAFICFEGYLMLSTLEIVLYIRCHNVYTFVLRI